MTKPVSHHLDIYGAWLHLATDVKGWTKLRKQHGTHLAEDPGAAGLTTFATWVPNDPGITEPHLFLFIDVAAHRDDTAGMVETCAHEAVHAATHLLMHVGHKVRRHDEPFAYLVGWLTQWIYATCAERQS